MRPFFIELYWFRRSRTPLTVLVLHYSEGAGRRGVQKPRGRCVKLAQQQKPSTRLTSAVPAVVCSLFPTRKSRVNAGNPL